MSHLQHLTVLLCGAEGTGGNFAGHADTTGSQACEAGSRSVTMGSQMEAAAWPDILLIKPEGLGKRNEV